MTDDRTAPNGWGQLYKVEHNWQDTSLYMIGRSDPICTFSLSEDEVTEDNQDDKEAEQALLVDFIIRACNTHYELLEALENFREHVLKHATQWDNSGVEATLIWQSVADVITKARGEL